jgi:hypothetical protein
VGAQAGEVLRDEQWQALALEVDVPFELGCRSAGSHRPHQPGDVVLGESSGRDDRRPAIAREIARQAPEPMPGRHPLGPPGQDQQQRPAGEPPAEVGDGVEGRVVGGVYVVHEDHAGLGSRTGSAEHGRDALDQPHLRTRPAERQQVGPVRAEGRKLGEQQPGVCQALWWDDLLPAAGFRMPRRLAQQLDDGSVRQPGLVVVASSLEHHCSGCLGAPDQLGRQAGLADAGLALDHGQPAVGTGLGVGVKQGRQLLRPADQL